MAKKILVPKESRVCIKVWVPGAKIPTDGQGRFVTQVHGPSSGGNGVKRGTILFGDWRDSKERAGRFQLNRLMEQGFCINNIYAVADPKKEGYFFVHVWLNHDESGSGKSIADWFEAGAFVSKLLSVPRSYVSIFDNGDLIAVNMHGYPVTNEKKHFDHIIPTVVTPVVPAKVVPIKTLVAAAVAPVVVSGHEPTAMENALRAARRL